MHPVDSDSCSTTCADEVVALGASKGGSTGDVDGRVANCWRPAGPCTSRSFAAACSVGGSGGPDGLGTARGSLQLRFERGSNVAMRPSACGCMHMVAELLLGHQTPCMLPRSIPGVPFHSAGLDGPPRVAKVVHCGVGVTGPHTHRRLGGSYIGRGAGRNHEKLFSFGFLCHTLLNRYRPDFGTLTTTCHRLRKRWDENTPSSKGPHKQKLQAAGD